MQQCYKDCLKTIIEKDRDTVWCRLNVYFTPRQEKSSEPLCALIRSKSRPERPAWFTVSIVFSDTKYYPPTIHLHEFYNYASIYHQTDRSYYQRFWKGKGPLMLCTALYSLYRNLDMPLTEFRALPITLQASGTKEPSKKSSSKKQQQRELSDMSGLVKYYEKHFGFTILPETERAKHHPDLSQKDINICVPMIGNIATIIDRYPQYFC